MWLKQQRYTPASVFGPSPSPVCLARYELNIDCAKGVCLSAGFPGTGDFGLRTGVGGGRTWGSQRWYALG